MFWDDCRSIRGRSGSTLGRPWVDFGSTLGMSRPCFGHVPGMFRPCSGHVPAMFRPCSGMFFAPAKFKISELKIRQARQNWAGKARISAEIKIAKYKIMTVLGV